MNPFTQKLMQLMTGILFALPLGGCASLSAEPLEGHVLEEGTHKPIPEAIVIARWDKTYSSLVDTTTVCVHVESATTDEQGRYQLPRWRGKTPNHIDTYKTGYERSNEYFRTKAYLQHNDILKLFTGTGEERLAYLSRMAVSCSDKKEIEINLLPLYKALYEEARSLAVTKKEDRLKVLYRLRDVERLELGSDKAWENFRQRERELK